MIQTGKKILYLLEKIVAHTCIYLIYLIRPILGPMNVCPYEIGCTQYALQQLKEQPLFIALFNSTKRILSCNPINRKKD